MSKGEKPININIPVVPESVDNAIKNLTDGPTRSMGQTLSDIWYLVFGGISQKAAKRRMKYEHDLELYQQELADSISKIPKEKKSEPDIQVTAQALENSKYCLDSSELRELFVNLISKSMDSDFENDIHPSFAEIIKQMSPLDARILKSLQPSRSFPLVDYIVEDKHVKDYEIKLSNVYISDFSEISIEQASNSISSLNRLGIIEIDTHSILSQKTTYAPYKETSYYQKLLMDTRRRFAFKQANIREYLGRFTPLGKNFFQVCVKDL